VAKLSRRSKNGWRNIYYGPEFNHSSEVVMNRSILRIALFASVMTCVGLGIAGCGVQGTYKDKTGNVTMELKGDGKATFSMMGQSADCTYKTDGDKVSVTCMGITTDFTKQSDGSLSAGPDSQFGSLKKQ
jgi:hypothetical protein